MAARASGGSILFKLARRDICRSSVSLAPRLTPCTTSGGGTRSMSCSASLRSLNIGNINPNVKNAQYAVRGELAVRAEKYREKLNQDRPPTPSTGDDSVPFDSVISANIGNPQQLDQKPLTFLRQVASLCENPELLDKEKVLVEHLGYKQDVIDRARWLLHDVKSVGAYSHSQGAPAIRESVARYIERRDGYSADPEQIFLSAGASAAVGVMLNIIIGSSTTGVLVPIPQYPLYTATLSLLDGRCCPYYLDEGNNWSTNLDTIKKSLVEARKHNIDVRAMVVINPGNPTGGILQESEIRDIIDFASEEKLVILADEVYQQNVFEGSFTSFKKVLRKMQARDHKKYDPVELASLHSISKGMTGECGHRGGYMELTGFDQEVVAQIYKYVSISLCPPVIGQCMVECMVNPPKPGDPSYELYQQEYNHIFTGLKERADALYEAFKEMEGVWCQKPQGAMYLFPSIQLGEKVKQQAEKEDRSPDGLYISRMLDATGVCMVPGDGFGQADGTYHFRTTFLPPGTDWVDRLKRFHKDFTDQFRD